MMALCDEITSLLSIPRLTWAGPLEKNDTREALTLVTRGADPNTAFEPAPTPSLRHLLDLVVHHTRPTDTKCPTAFLMACGSDGTDRYTPLEFSVQFGSLTTMRLLLEHGASVNLLVKAGDTPLSEAVLMYTFGSSAIMRLLLDHGANPNVRNKKGRTVLLMARTAKRSDIVTILRQAGAKP